MINEKNNFLTVSWLSGLLSAEIFISTGEWGVQMPPLTSENSYFLRSGPQGATLVMFYSLGGGAQPHRGSISGNSYHSQNENMSGLKSACSNPIRQRKCSVFVCFRVSLCHCTLCAYTDVEHVHFRRVVPTFGTVFIGTVSVA